MASKACAVLSRINFIHSKCPSWFARSPCTNSICRIRCSWVHNNNPVCSYKYNLAITALLIQPSRRLKFEHTRLTATLAEVLRKPMLMLTEQAASSHGVDRKQTAGCASPGEGLRYAPYPVRCAPSPTANSLSELCYCLPLQQFVYFTL